MLTPHRPPPEDYYQNNCIELLSFVLATYGRLLSSVEAESVAAYLKASDDAQRLFARLLTRKGALFRLDSLNYDEVSDLQQALRELADLELVRFNPDMLRADALLAKLTKEELCSLDFPGLKKSLNKVEIIAAILSGRSERQVVSRALQSFEFAWLRNHSVWHKALYLYFGDRHQDWSTFVRRDLGQIKFPLLNVVPRFEQAEELTEALQYSWFSGLSHRIGDHPGLAPELITALEQQPADRWLWPRRERALLRIAKHLERSERPEDALGCYQHVKAHPARERMVRILAKSGDQQRASKLLKEIEHAPWCEEESQFVARFGRRNGGYQPYTEVRQMQIRRTASIEQEAGQWLCENGEAEWCLHTENSLLRTLTGLLYWPVLFADVPGAFTNPFQTAPNDLYLSDFSHTRAAYIAEIEQAVTEDRGLEDRLLDAESCYGGIANDLVSWRLLSIFPVQQILKIVPVDHVRKVSAFLIRNLWQLSAGMPDLFVAWKSGGYSLVEIKGPGDRLRPGQRIWFSHLEQLGIPALVMRLQVP